MNKKFEKIIMIILIFIAIFSIIINRPLTDLDEMWNYNAARVISEGYIPYKDVSMITTPFYQFVMAFLLKIFPNEMFTFRIIIAIFWTAIFFLISEIMYLITGEENISCIFTLIIYCICKESICLDYNFFSLFLTLIILYLELRKIKNNECFTIDIKYNILIGFLSGLIICTKQSVGVTSAIIVILYNLIFVKEKKDFKNFIKIGLYRILGMLIPVIILFIYLALNSAIEDFFDYAVFGISTFTNKIKYKKLFESTKKEIRFLSRLMPISLLVNAIIIFTKKLFSDDEKLNIKTIFIYSFSIIIVMYPISDDIHFLIGSIIPIMNILYVTFLLCKKIYDKINFKKKKFLYKTVTLIVFLVLFAINIRNNFGEFLEYQSSRKCMNQEHYKYIPMDESYEERIINVKNFIDRNEKDGTKVYILDSEAVLYTIPANVYNKNYDLFLLGNLGKDGEYGQIKKIENSNENAIYLVKKEEYGYNWQTPMNVINYIKINLHKSGEIELFDIYKNY